MPTDAAAPNAKPRLTDDDIAEVFEMFDTDRSGVLTNEELLFALKSLGLSGASKLSLGDASDMIRVAKYKHHGDDGPYDGSSISKEEFVVLIGHNVPAAGSTAEMDAAFKLFDTRGKGTLCLEDFMAAFCKINEKEVDALSAAEKKTIADMFLVADRRGRGVSLEDWRFMISQA